MASVFPLDGALFQSWRYRPRLLLPSLLLLSAALSACVGARIGNVPGRTDQQDSEASIFENATRGFTSCQLGSLFIDEHARATPSPYLQAIEDRRCDVTDTLVTYCIQERFHGLPVTRLAVPRTTLPVFALYFDVPLEAARSTLMARLGKDFRPSHASLLGAEPELIRDPADALGSILICTKHD